MKNLFIISFLALLQLIMVIPAAAGTFESNRSGNIVEPIFREGDMVLNIGLGLGSSLYRGRYYSMRVPPVSASFELGIQDDFLTEDMTLGVGGYVGYAASRYQLRQVNWGWDYNYLVFGGRASLHYPFVEQLDTYGGVMLAANIVISSEFGTGQNQVSADGGGFIYSLYAGGRYYFADNFAVFAEIGYGVSYLNAGIAIRL